MEKENKKLTAEYVKEERKRLLKLAHQAYKKDPRILKMIAEQEEAKRAAKQAKKDAKVKQAQERDGFAKAVEEEKRRVEREAEEAKQRKGDQVKQAQKHYKETTKKLLEICGEKLPGTRFDKFFVEGLIPKYPKQEQLDDLIGRIDAIATDDAREYAVEFEKIIKADEEKRESLLKQRQAAQEAAKKEQKAAKGLGVWSHDDEAKLTLAVNKFPAGTGNRWKVIAEYVGRNLKEVIAKAKEMQERKQTAVDAKRKEEADLKAKREAIRAEVKGQAKADAEAKAKQQKAAAVPDPNAWTAAQQKQMETGMREVPSSVAVKERWIKIADGVDGKTAKECYTRFKELCAKAKQK